MVNPRMYIAPGYRIEDARVIVEKTEVGIMANAYLMRSSDSHRYAILKLKKDTKTFFGLDNGAYQAWKYKIRSVPAELLLHYADLLDCDLVIVQDVIGNIVETRRLHQEWSKWIDSYPLVAVLQGATISRDALESDVKYYKDLGYRRFAYPYPAAGPGLIQKAKELTTYLHGLGMGKLVPKWMLAFNSVDIGLWFARQDKYKAYSIETAIQFIQKIQRM